MYRVVPATLITRQAVATAPQFETAAVALPRLTCPAVVVIYDELVNTNPAFPPVILPVTNSPLEVLILRAFPERDVMTSPLIVRSDKESAPPLVKLITFVGVPLIIA
jgi:hypothetical protein